MTLMDLRALTDARLADLIYAMESRPATVNVLRAQRRLAALCQQGNPMAADEAFAYLLRLEGNEVDA